MEHSGNYEKAIAHFQKTLAINPVHPKAHFDLAVAYYELGDKANAANHYEHATSLNPMLKTEINNEIFKYEPPVVGPAPIHVEEKAFPKVNDNEKVVLITGATSGIGLATAELFSQHGFRVILTGRRTERLDSLKEKLEDSHKNKVHLLNFDVRSIDSVNSAIASLDEEWKNVDILINNAGLASGFEPIQEGDVSDWDAMIDTNIKGLLYMTRAVAPLMVARSKGHIINICSLAGKEAYPNGAVYVATKHAVDALTKGMRLDLYKHNIRVGQVAPGMVEETEFALVRFHGDAEKAKIYGDIEPLKASNVADIIYFMVSQPAYVNIQDVLVMATQQASANHKIHSGRS